MIEFSSENTNNSSMGVGSVRVGIFDGVENYSRWKFFMMFEIPVEI
jgi:hypothetical protein